MGFWAGNWCFSEPQGFRLGSGLFQAPPVRVVNLSKRKEETGKEKVKDKSRGNHHTCKNTGIRALPCFFTNLHDPGMLLSSTVPTCELLLLPLWLTRWQDWPWAFVRNSEVCELNSLEEINGHVDIYLYTTISLSQKWEHKHIIITNIYSTTFFKNANKQIWTPCLQISVATILAKKSARIWFDAYILHRKMQHKIWGTWTDLTSNPLHFPDGLWHAGITWSTKSVRSILF